MNSSATARASGGYLWPARWLSQPNSPGDPPWSNFPSNTLTQVGTLVVPNIELSWEALDGNTPLDANPNTNGGVRVYPDQLSPTDTQSRRSVFLKVRTTPPVPGQRAHVSFWKGRLGLREGTTDANARYA